MITWFCDQDWQSRLATWSCWEFMWFEALLRRYSFNLSENVYNFWLKSLVLFFAHFVETDHKKWFSWNFFIIIEAFFFIVMYNSHVLHSYSSHLIRSLNHVNFVFHFMLSIKSTKYRSFLFSTIVNYNNDTYLLIESSFKNHNRLIWNIEWTFILNNNLNLYV